MVQAPCLACLSPRSWGSTPACLRSCFAWLGCPCALLVQHVVALAFYNLHQTAPPPDLDLGVGVAHGAAVVGADVGDAALAECQAPHLRGWQGWWQQGGVRQHAAQSRGAPQAWSSGMPQAALLPGLTCTASASATHISRLHRQRCCCCNANAMSRLQNSANSPCRACRTPPPW